VICIRQVLTIYFNSFGVLLTKGVMEPLGRNKIIASAALMASCGMARYIYSQCFSTGQVTDTLPTAVTPSGPNADTSSLVLMQEIQDKMDAHHQELCAVVESMWEKQRSGQSSDSSDDDYTHVDSTASKLDQLLVNIKASDIPCDRNIKRTAD
jgi:hypothetical protein